MFEIIMYWVWVTVFTILTLYAGYWFLYHVGNIWSGFLLRKAGYTDDEIEQWRVKYKNFVSTPFKIVHFEQDQSGRYDEDTPTTATIIKIIILMISMAWTTIFLIHGFDGVDSLATNAIFEINRLATLLANHTAWAGLPFTIFAGGSMIFVSLAKLIKRLKPILDKID